MREECVAESRDEGLEAGRGYQTVRIQEASRLGRRVGGVGRVEAAKEVGDGRRRGRRGGMDCGAILNVPLKTSEIEGVCDTCGGPLIHRIDDEPDTVLHRLEVYQEQTAPLVALYEAHEAGLVRVEAERGMDDVYADVRTAVGV